MMLLFPLWVVLISVPCVYAAARYTRSSLATLCVSLSFLVSGTAVLLSFTRFTEGVSIAYLNDFLFVEVGRLTVLSSLFFMVCSIPFLVYYLPVVSEDRLPEAAGLIHLLIVSALGSFFAADLLSFVLLFEAVPLFALALVVSEGKIKSSPYQHLLYFVPFLLLLLFTGLAAESLCALHALTFQVWATLLLAAALAARLLLFPFGRPSLKCLPLGEASAVSYALFSLPAVALVALVKFLPYSRLLGQVVLILAALSMIVWATLCYRQRKPGNVILYAYLAQTACVATMVVYSMPNGGSGPGASFVILGNHLVSSLGLLLCISLDEGKRGRLGNGALVFFIVCMLGLPPSPGFFGRLVLFKISLAAPDLPSYLLRLSFLISLFTVYCQSRCLAPVIQQIKRGTRCPRPLSLALILLAGCLLAAMIFGAQLRQYLEASGL
jgi:formate hydrogenlyase subunit 3/multisubunit Na+/H+ antiporter MnhD subunit